MELFSFLAAPSGSGAKVGGKYGIRHLGHVPCRAGGRVVEGQSSSTDSVLKGFTSPASGVIVGANLNNSMRKVNPMNRFRPALLAVVAVLSLLAAVAEAQERGAPEQVSSDTPRLTPGGATFTIPKEWSIVTGKNLVILTPPETDTHIVIFDSQAGDATAAVTAAWAAYKPEAKRPVKLVTTRPPKEGWDERKIFE